MLLSATLRVMRAIGTGLLSRNSCDLSELSFRVWPTDVDLNLHLTNSRYPQIMDAGRAHLAMCRGDFGAVMRARLRPVLVHLAIDFQHELKLGAAFQLRSSVLGTERRAIVVEQRFLVGDRVHARGLAHVVLVGRSGVVKPDAYLSTGATMSTEAALDTPNKLLMESRV